MDRREYQLAPRVHDGLELQHLMHAEKGSLALVHDNRYRSQISLSIYCNNRINHVSMPPRLSAFTTCDILGIFDMDVVVFIVFGMPPRCFGKSNA